MIHNQIKHIAVYESWQACPIIGGSEYRLCDFPRATEAAWGVDYALSLHGLPPVNSLTADQTPTPERQAAIKVAMQKAMCDRGILPKPVVEGAAKKGKASAPAGHGSSRPASAGQGSD